MPKLIYRSIVLERASADSTSQTVDASLSSEAVVERYPGEVEVLSHDPSAVDLTRAADGLPLLFAHDHREPIGIVENVRIEAKRLVGRLRFGASQRAKEIFADVQAGVLKNLSVGYVVHESEPIEGGYMATRWSIYEASIVGVPLDATVGVGRSANIQGVTMPAAPHEVQSPALEASNLSTRAASQIREAVRIAGFGDDVALDMIERGMSVDAVRSEMFRRMAARSNEAPTRSIGGDSWMYGDYGHRGGQNEVSVMAEALAVRFGVAPTSDQAREFTSLRVVDMARRCLETQGIRTTGMNASTLISRGLNTTSDFPKILSTAGELVLRKAYSTYQGGVRQISKPSTARDFKAKTVAALGEMPELLEVREGGEFKYGTRAEAAESYRLKTYGRIFGISRQALVNDDLQAFADTAVAFGKAAAEFEAGFLASLLASNPAMSDGKALFHTDHSNLAVAGGAIGVSTLSAARLSMRLQKGLDGKSTLNVVPRYLVVPASLETSGEQVLAEIAASKISDVNPFSSRLELVVDPRLDAYSATTWYLAADPDLTETIEYSYLDTDVGPVIEYRDGFEVDGLEVKVRLDFGAGLLDWRGLWKNSGS